ncbi:MAG: DEAD/DEAH box helicase family protein [Acidobacteriota bacterium]|nr:DEAD/DEAH box helicase family protein [Acidobacteriota bacterium]
MNSQKVLLLSQVVIENPIINSPFLEPSRHFRFDENNSITTEILPGRRPSSHVVPVAQPRARRNAAQQQLPGDFSQDLNEPNKLVNDIRLNVGRWRSGGYSGITATTRRLLDYWTDPARERRLFFCQIEALETAIYLAEAANKFTPHLRNDLRDVNEASNPGLYREAFKMATGSGKTVVMAMLIAWHTLNKRANPQDARFSDSFLIVTPGITVKDRLEVLKPNNPANYYAERDIVPMWQRDQLEQARIVITNYHSFLPREKEKVTKTTKSILAAGGQPTLFTESPADVVRRVCGRDFGPKRNIVDLNDEAHHCYRGNPKHEDVPPPTGLDADARDEIKENTKAARAWITGLEFVQARIGLKAIYDLSATPFFLRGSGYSEGTLFPWVISDFSLVEAIEAGIVKIPRVPVADDALSGDQPTYRNLWLRIREELPRKGRATEAAKAEPTLPKELEGALFSLYYDYEKRFEAWKNNAESQARGLTAPVFIVVCNNTNVSKMVFDFVSGWEKELPPPEGSETPQKIVQAGKLNLFRNDDERGGWRHRPVSMLVDSVQLDSGEGMSDDFRTIAAREIDEFKSEYVRRFPGRDADSITPEDLLREALNTVGKPGKLGEHVRCVVSVSMLTEGWDANTVTHILGVRAFGTQLLCEHVVGRALRRMSYSATKDPETGEDRFAPEYAEVYGIPFSFIPAAGATKEAEPGPMPTRVRSLEDRLASLISFPRLLGYRYELPDARLTAKFTDASRFTLSSASVPTETELSDFTGGSTHHTLDILRSERENAVAFELAKAALERYLRSSEDKLQPWLFPQMLGITKRWIAECLECKDNTFPQLLMFGRNKSGAIDKIFHAMLPHEEDGALRVLPIVQPYDTLGSTRYVDFFTTRPTFSTQPNKCHVSHVVADTDAWEQNVAYKLERMEEVMHYVKNDHLGFTIPYTFEGNEKQYVPDFIVCVDDGNGPSDLLHLIVEVSGERGDKKLAKVSTAKNLWVPAVNNHGTFGRWSYLEITDPTNLQTDIRKHVGSTQIMSALKDFEVHLTS